MIRNPFLEEVFDKAVPINLENDETAEEYRRSSQRTEDSLFLEDVRIRFTKIIIQSIKFQWHRIRKLPFYIYEYLSTLSIISIKYD